MGCFELPMALVSCCRPLAGAWNARISDRAQGLLKDRTAEIAHGSSRPTHAAKSYTVVTWVLMPISILVIQRDAEH